MTGPDRARPVVNTPNPCFPRVCRLSFRPFHRLVILLALAGLASAAEGGASAPRRRYDLAAGDAGTTLRRFAEQSGEQVLYVVPRVRDVTTQAVKGEFTAREVLDLMLKDTALVVVEDARTGALIINRATEAGPAVQRAPARVRPAAAAPRGAARHKNPVAWLGGLFAPAAADAPDRTAAPVASGEEVLELSPFVVNASEDSGYQASSTLAGSRINTSLRDTAASVSVLTAELLSDIGALNLDDAVAFANNVEFDDTQFSNDNAMFEFFNMFRVRGQAASIGRNYFRWRLPTNTFNVERIEEARGPNSILFGIASAGGIVSAQTKQASIGRDILRAQLIYGSYDLRRASVDLNQSSLNGRLGVRFNAVVSDVHGYQHFVSNRDDRVHLALKYALVPNTVIRAEYEKGRTRSNRANTQEISDSLMGWFNAGRPVVNVTATDNALGITRLGAGVGSIMVVPIEESPGVVVFGDYRGLGITQGAGSALITDPAVVNPVNFKVNLGGAGQTQDSDFDTWSAFIEHKLFKSTFLQLAYNHQESVFHSWQARNSNTLKGDPNQFLQDGVTPNPHAGRMYFENWWTNYNRWDTTDNYRFSISQEINLGQWGEYRLAGLAEREESRFINLGYTEQWFDSTTGRGAFNQNPGAGVNRVFRRHYITLGDYGTYFASFNNPGMTGVLSNVTDPSNAARKLETRLMPAGGFDDKQEQDSYLFSGQAFYFKRRLVLAGGYRADTLYLHESVRNQIDPVTLAPLVDTVNLARINRTVEAATGTLGAVCHVFPWLSLRANRSNSEELADVRVRLMPRRDARGVYAGGSRIGDNPQGRGEDYGIDLNLFAGKVFIWATRFETTRAGAQGFTYGGTGDNPSVMNNRILTALSDSGLISETEFNRRALNTGGSQFDVKSTGYEFGVTANPSRNWRLTANCSITDSASDNIAPEIQQWAADTIPYFQAFDQNLLVATGDTIAREIARWQSFNATNLSVAGVATIGNRRDKVSFLTRYTFTAGALKGLYVGASARHQGRMVIAARTDGSSLYGNSFTRSDAFLGYRFDRVPRLPFLRNLNVQLNVYNVLDQHDPLIRRVSDANADVLQVSRLAAQEPRYWRVSADLAF